MSKSQKVVARPATVRSVLQETMEELRTVDDLAQTVMDSHNAEVLVAAMHRDVEAARRLLEPRT